MAKVNEIIMKAFVKFKVQSKNFLEMRRDQTGGRKDRWTIKAIHILKI